MAISRMTKILIATHRSEAESLLDALQQEGLCHILALDRSTLKKEFPDLISRNGRFRELEEAYQRIERVIQFLAGYRDDKRSFLEKALSPRQRVDDSFCRQVVSDEKIDSLLNEADDIRHRVDSLQERIDELEDEIENLKPWRKLEIPVEELHQMEKAECIAGVAPCRSMDDMVREVKECGALVDIVDCRDSLVSVLIVVLNEQVRDVRNILRTKEYDEFEFTGLQGRIKDIISDYREEISVAADELRRHRSRATELAGDLLKLQVLSDHYGNLLQRERTRNTVPVTEESVLFEGWVRQRDLARLRAIMKRFSVSDLAVMERAEGDEPPVAIDNPPAFRPFEVITRLYGLPKYREVDPTSLLAPFFIVFFALCLTDAAYGLLLAGIMFFALRRKQGNKQLVRLLCWAGLLTILTGAITGGWFGSALRDVAAAAGWKGLGDWIERMTLFDPMQQPMVFFVLAIILGYLQIMFGLCVALVVNLSRRDIKAALCDQVSWLVMLNSLVVLALAGMQNALPPLFGDVALWTTIIAAATILFFSHRDGGIGGRLGMGAYNLFSTVFYLGDVLSYLRLMALGLATAGVAMAVNVIAETSLGIPYIGIILALLLFIVGHLFNIAMSSLGAFVHTMRLQFVEFFPKFLVGGGEEFKPLARDYKYIYMDQNTKEQPQEANND